MAQPLHNFTADIQPMGRVPEGRPAEAGNVGNAIAGLGETLGGIAQRQFAEHEKQDVLSTYTDVAQARVRAMSKLDALQQTGQPVADKFHEYLEAEMQTVRQNRTTTAGLQVTDQHFANLAADLGQVAYHSDVALAATTAKDSARAAADANGIALQKDPTLLPRILSEQDGYVDAIPGITPTLAAELKKGLKNEAAKNAGLGAIALEPVSAKAALEKGTLDPFLTDESRTFLLQKAEQGIHDKESEARIAREDAQRQQREQQDQLMNVSLANLYEGKLSAKAIGQMARDQRLSPTQISHLYSVKETVAREGSVKTDMRVLVDVVQASHDGTLTQATMNDLALRGKLSEGDFKLYSNVVSEGDTALKHARTQVSKDVGQAFFGEFPGFPLTGEQMTAKTKFDSVVRQREQEYRAAGKNPIDYYTNGEYANDAKLLAPKNGVLGGAQDFKAEMNAAAQRGEAVFDGKAWYKWSGQGSKKDPTQWSVAEPPKAGAKESGGLLKPFWDLTSAYQEGMREPPKPKVNTKAAGPEGQ